MEESQIEKRNSSTGISDISNDRTHYVIIIHGIRTQAEYQTRLANELEEDPTIKAITLGYEFLDVVRFLSFGRNGPFNKITTDIRDVKTMEPAPERISIIAHSFGTYIVSKILERHTDIDFHRIIFCGSIVPSTFRWDKYKGRFETPILNDCGMFDIWPVFAKFATWGYGPSGRFGFKSNRVRDRFHRFKHSDFFKNEFFKDYWKPFLDNGEIVEGELERETTPWWTSLLTLIKAPVLLLASGLLAVNLLGTGRKVPEPAIESSPEPTVESADGAVVDLTSLQGFEVSVETVDITNNKYEKIAPDFINWEEDYVELRRFVGDEDAGELQEEKLLNLFLLQESTPGASFKTVVVTNDAYWDGPKRKDAICEYIEQLLKSRADPLVDCRVGHETSYAQSEIHSILQEFIVQVSGSAGTELQKLDTASPSVTAEKKPVREAIVGNWKCQGGGFSYTLTLSSTGKDTFIGSANFGQTAPAGYNNQLIQNGSVSGSQIHWVRDPGRQNISVSMTLSDDALSMKGEGSGRDGEASIHCKR